VLGDDCDLFLEQQSMMLKNATTLNFLFASQALSFDRSELTTAAVHPSVVQ
jgi:hypothetical protein